MPVVFKPWIGEQYCSQNPKLLILGESHYLKEHEVNADFTINVIREFGLRENNKKLRFFTTITKILSGQPYELLSDEKSKEFWNNVAFYNFIQSSVGTEARIRPTKEMWQNSLDAFESVMNELKPDIIVILGKELGYKINGFESHHNQSIFCYWTHPSTPKYFKKQEAIGSFNDAMNIWINKNHLSI